MFKHEVYRFLENCENFNFYFVYHTAHLSFRYQKNQDFQNLLQFQIFILVLMLHIIFNCIYLGLYFFIQKKILV
jgi:hypothetical protein